MSSGYHSLEEVLQDEVFPLVDLALRRGKHIDRDEGDAYAFIVNAQDHLDRFYRRFGCELVSQSDGYFYLLPSGEELARRPLTAGEMLVGQALALYYLDPAILQAGGIVMREHLLTRLESILGDRELAKILEPRRRRFDNERLVHDIIRKRTIQALRALARLGFIELLDDDHLRLRAPLLRFTEPVRGLENAGTALERLIAQGKIITVEESAGLALAPDREGNGLEAADDESDETGSNGDADEDPEVDV
jgi:chromosome partition protein MukE